MLAEYGLDYSVWFLDSEEEAPASTYLRAVPKSVAGFVYTERGKSTKDTVNSLAITHTHTHTQISTCTHTCTDAHTQWSYSTLQVYNYRYGNMHKHLPYQNSNVEQHFFVAFFFLLSVWSFFTQKKKDLM